MAKYKITFKDGSIAYKDSDEALESSLGKIIDAGKNPDDLIEKYEFDDEYLNEVGGSEITSMPGAFMRGAIQGATANFADEALGLASDKAGEEVRRMAEISEAEHPLSYLAGDVTGQMVGQLTGGKYAGKLLNRIAPAKKLIQSLVRAPSFSEARPILTEALKGGVSGGVMGTAQEFGKAEDKSSKESIAKAIIQGLLGTGLGAVGGGAGGALGSSNKKAAEVVVKKILRASDDPLLDMAAMMASPVEARALQQVKTGLDEATSIRKQSGDDYLEYLYKKLEKGEVDLPESLSSKLKQYVPNTPDGQLVMTFDEVTPTDGGQLVRSALKEADAHLASQQGRYDEMIDLILKRPEKYGMLGHATGSALSSVAEWMRENSGDQATEEARIRALRILEALKEEEPVPNIEMSNRRRTGTGRF